MLVVEDDPGITALVTRIATACGYDVTPAASVDTFRDALRRVQPSLILVDLKLSGGDGVDVLSDLATLGMSAPVMISTGYGERTLRSASQLAGSLGLTVAGLFSKPLDVNRFRETLHTWAGDNAHLTDSAMRCVPTRKRALRHAVQRSEIVPVYQPQIDLSSGQAAGVEVLARWQYPDSTVLGPNEFIHLAEASDLILDLTVRLLAQALLDAKAWRAQGHDLSVSLNVPSRLLEIAEFPLAVEICLARHDMDPRKLILEITEGTPVGDLAQLLESTTRLCLQQVAISLDDLGTEHSCLSILHRLPLTEAKIDRQFVKHLATESESRSIVTGIIRMAHSLGLRVVAEGVEDAVAADFLRRAGADRAQGFLYSPPRPATQILPWLRDQ
jgi:EAL domain-containing protein (putative c-di-GMP-specific phosphodiesterase class I)